MISYNNKTTSLYWNSPRLLFSPSVHPTYLLTFRPVQIAIFARGPLRSPCLPCGGPLWSLSIYLVWDWQSLPAHWQLWAHALQGLWPQQEPQHGLPSNGLSIILRRLSIWGNKPTSFYKKKKKKKANSPKWPFSNIVCLMAVYSQVCDVIWQFFQYCSQNEVNIWLLLVRHIYGARASATSMLT